MGDTLGGENSGPFITGSFGDPGSGMLLDRFFGSPGTPDQTVTTPSRIPSTHNTYSRYIPDFLLVNTPFQFPDRYRQSLSQYAGQPGVDPVTSIQDIFMNPQNYGVYDPPKTTTIPGEDPKGFFSGLFG